MTISTDLVCASTYLSCITDSTWAVASDLNACLKSIPNAKELNILMRKKHKALPICQ